MHYFEKQIYYKNSKLIIWVILLFTIIRYLFKLIISRLNNIKIIDFNFDDEEDKNSEQKRQNEGSTRKEKRLLMRWNGYCFNIKAVQEREYHE